MAEKNYTCNICGWTGQDTNSYGEISDSTCPRCGGRVVPDHWVQTWGFVVALLTAFTFLIYVAVWVMTH